MATKKSEINPDKILLTIYAATHGRQKQIDVELQRVRDADYREYQDAYQRLMTERAAAEWMPYRLDDIAGYSLDSAARKRWQRAVLALESQRSSAFAERRFD